jgi:hypothetical protein
VRELRPLVEEHNRLEQAAAALAGVGKQAPSSPTRRRRSSSGNGRRSGARGRPRGSGARAKQALELVRTQPGITISQMADAMQIKANYLYRVMPTLQSEGQVTKRDGGWHPA